MNFEDESRKNIGIFSRISRVTARDFSKNPPAERTRFFQTGFIATPDAVQLFFIVDRVGRHRSPYATRGVFHHRPKKIQSETNRRSKPARGATEAVYKDEDRSSLRRFPESTPDRGKKIMQRGKGKGREFLLLLVTGSGPLQGQKKKRTRQGCLEAGVRRGMPSLTRFANKRASIERVPPFSFGCSGRNGMRAILPKNPYGQFSGKIFFPERGNEFSRGAPSPTR